MSNQTEIEAGGGCNKAADEGRQSSDLFCSCQSRELKDAGLNEERTMKDSEGNYYRIVPNIGDTFFVRPLDMEEYSKF